ncbi:MAG: hypothetical protein COA32_08930 [Fluviicola sp.]|nr:MAG: hypothetical protein COA32_08930 [Fluviicola sp.]
MCDSIQGIIDTHQLLDTVCITLPNSVYLNINETQNSDNSSFGAELLKNSITILIALLAGFIALLQVKSNIISSARIKWLETLRVDLSELYSSSLNTVHYFQRANENTGDIKNEANVKYENNHSRCNILVHKIIMNLNPKEREHKKLIDLVNKIDEIIDSDSIENSSQTELEKILKEIVTQSRLVFKPEWDKSKRLFKR